MPKDQRLYMTFPIDFPDHPKVKPLSALAKWTFVEMNAYSRRLGLDGIIPAATAHAIWAKRPLADLVASHPERPLVLLVDEAYVIRDYAEHQMTTSDIEDLREKRSAAGAKGGKAKAQAKQTASNSLASAKANVWQSLAESESESELELKTDVTIDTESSHLSIARAEDSDPEIWSAKAKLAGISDLPNVMRLLTQATGQTISARGAVELAQAILSKSAKHVRNVDAYVATVCRESAAEVQQAYFDLDIEAVA